MLWNICQSVVEPVGTLKVNTGEKHADATNTSTGCALNKSIWMEDGRKLLVGDSRYGLYACIFFRLSRDGCVWFTLTTAFGS